LDLMQVDRTLARGGRRRRQLARSGEL
jgi:hypothetical protein